MLRLVSSIEMVVQHFCNTIDLNNANGRTFMINVGTVKTFCVPQCSLAINNLESPENPRSRLL